MFKTKFSSQDMSFKLIMRYDEIKDLPSQEKENNTKQEDTLGMKVQEEEKK